MSCVYVTEQGSRISVGNGKLVIECKKKNFSKEGSALHYFQLAGTIMED